MLPDRRQQTLSRLINPQEELSSLPFQLLYPHPCPTDPCPLAAAFWAAATAAAQPTPHINRWEPGMARWAPNRVLVRFKPTITTASTATVATATATAAAADPLAMPGLELKQLVGKHYAVRVPQTSGGAATSAVGDLLGEVAPTSTVLPSDATIAYEITGGWVHGWGWR